SAVAAPAAAGAPTASETGRLVVAVFHNETGDSALDPLGEVVADYLARGVAETGLLEVIDGRVERSADVGSGDLARALALARRLGAGRLLWGSYARQGDSLRFEAHLTDVATGQPLGNMPPVVSSGVRPTQGVETLRQRVMVTLAVRLNQ